MTVYRTPGAWGAGQGYDLTAAQVDMNFWGFAQRIQALEDNPPEPMNWSNVYAVGTQCHFVLPNATEFVITLPQAAFRPSVGTQISTSSHSVVGANSNAFLYLTNPGGCAVTFDDDSVLDINEEVTFYGDTDGLVTFDSSTDIQLIVPPGFLKQIRGRGFTVGFKKRAAGVYVGVGTFAEDVTA